MDKFKEVVVPFEVTYVVTKEQKKLEVGTIIREVVLYDNSKGSERYCSTFEVPDQTNPCPKMWSLGILTDISNILLYTRDVYIKCD